MKTNQLLLKIKTRTILYTFSIIRDIVDVSNKLNKNLSVMPLDFLKVFDRTDWDFISSILQKFGYGEKFIHMIKVSYSNIQSKIKINGLLSDPFTHKREVFQVCALSMLLYFILAELLPSFIDTNKRIKGIQVG